MFSRNLLLLSTLAPLRLARAGGRAARRSTKQSPSYWQAWSPDGKTLLCSGKRKGKPAIFTIPAAGGAETMLNAGDGANENPVYSPDGKYVYFDSDRDGSRQIWRMLADGTGQEQVTADDSENWNPHISPDGLKVAFLSANKGAAGKAEESDLKLRSMVLSTKAIRMIANLVGGKGTLSAKPWSPDSRTLTFVS